MRIKPFAKFRAETAGREIRELLTENNEAKNEISARMVAKNSSFNLNQIAAGVGDQITDCLDIISTR